MWFSILFLVLSQYSERLQAAQKIFIAHDPSQGSKDETAAVETSRHHALEKAERLLDQVQVLEAKHGVRKRWTPECTEWIAASSLTASHRYQKALDTLEGLVVAWLFELTKMNMSRTGNISVFLSALYLWWYRL